MTECSLMLNKLSSKEFNTVLEKKLEENCNDPETIEYIKKSSLKKRY